MQQTLLALAAVLAFSSYALTRHRADADVERRAIDVEVEVMATGLSQSWMAQVQQFAFDEEDAESEEGGIRRTAPRSILGPDAGETTDTFDDVDDWDGHRVRVSLPGPAGDLAFDLAITVEYVTFDASGSGDSAVTPSAVPTLAKRVSVSVSEVVDGSTQRPPVQTVLRRLVTPTSLAINQ